MKRPVLRDLSFDAFASRLAAESDRACGVLGAALLDASLEDLFRRSLKHEQDELLGPNGPLGTFSARIRIARSLCWIDDDTANDLNAIRGIRNDFAHSFDHDLSFSTPSIAGRCGHLISAASYLDGISESANYNPNFSTAIFESIRAKFSAPRWRFQIAVESISQLLRELVSASAVYEGPSLRSEVFDAAARTRLRVQGTGIVGPRPEE